MEVEEIIKNVEKSFENKECAFVDLLKTKSNNVSKYNLDNYVNLVKRIFESRNYSCEVKLEKDKNNFYYRLRIKNPQKN